MTPRRVARYPLSRKPILPALAMVASLVTGCADPSARDSVVEPNQALLAKEGRVDTSPRASLVWADSVVVNGSKCAGRDPGRRAAQERLTVVWYALQ